MKKRQRALTMFAAAMVGGTAASALSTLLADPAAQRSEEAPPVTTTVRPGGSVTIRHVQVTLVRSPDLDGDGRVGTSDRDRLLARWGGSDTHADLDQDGTVDGVDLALLLGAWTR
jgi:hypothetical protein